MPSAGEGEEKGGSYLMKKKIIMLVLSVLLVVSVASAAVAVGADDRQIYGVNQKGNLGIGTVPIVGEILDDGHIYLERYERDGSFIQWVDMTGNYECDFVAYWKAIDDPAYGRFYKRIGNRECPELRPKK